MSCIKCDGKGYTYEDSGDELRVKCTCLDDVTQKTIEIQEETLLHLLMTRKHLRAQVASLQGEMTKMQFAERDLELDIKLHEGVKPKYKTELPKYQSEGAAGMDLAAREDHVVRHGGKVLIPTGVSIALPRGFVGLVQPRSGLSWKKDQLAVTGMIDSDYRGEIHVQLFNMGQDMYRVKQGDRIAQLIILRRPKVAWKQVAELSETARGTNGFGSTGGE